MPTIDFKDIGEILKHRFLQGTIVTIDPATDTCTVNVNGSIVPAILFFHCTGAEAIRENGAVASAATEFVVGDQVFVVLGKNAQDEDIIRVISPLIKRKCVPLPIGDYYIFYLDGTLKIANCSWESGLTVVETKNAVDLGVTNPNNYPVKFLLKRFTHNVPVNGVPTARDLYFVSTSLQLAGQYTGWTNFATANPTFPLVTNNFNTKIAMTPQVLTDLNNVNYAVNHAHAYTSDYPNDNWRIMGAGESGDCEDFALTKAQELLALGYPASALHIEVGVINAGLAHAWLVVQTSAGNYALDTSSDTAIINSSLVPSIGGTYYSRHRQIGSNWASISPFAWLDGAVNTNQIYQYILDPLLNIVYLWYWAVGGLFTWHWLAGFNIFHTSVNFSTDGNDIYVQYDYLTYPTESRTRKYKLEENKLTFISEWINSVSGLVKNDGSIFVPSGGNYKVISKIGYYDYLNTDPIQSQPQAIISMETNNPFYFESGYYHTAFGETIFPESESYPYRWCHIEIGDITIQAFYFSMWAIYDSWTDDGPRANYIIPRMYKNGASCLDAVTAAVGATEANLFGLAYIPSTNRLN
jgi:predicted transglutaminase-like cysteine proteinase